MMSFVLYKPKAKVLCHTSKLAEIQRQLSLPEHKLMQDVSTRWNSTYIMLERFYEQFEAITTTLSLVNQNDLCLKAEVTTVISKTLQLLKPFLETTEIISGQAYVSISMIVPLTKILSSTVALFLQPITCWIPQFRTKLQIHVY